MNPGSSYQETDADRQVIKELTEDYDRYFSLPELVEGPAPFEQVSFFDESKEIVLCDSTEECGLAEFA